MTSPMRLFALSTAAALTLVGSASASGASPQPASTALVTTAAARPTPYDPSEYKLGPGDKIRIIVYNETNLTGEFIISPSGSLSFPLIGDVQAGDKTISGLQRALETRLKEGYLRNPHVSIEVLTFRPFYILGEVGKPGEYPYTAGLTVMKAVATAQGYTYRANTKRVFIRHANDQDERGVLVTSTTFLAPGDTIRIPERHF